jgi:uncharacterized membrane protein YkvA (DUF1232 family)
LIGVYRTWRKAIEYRGVPIFLHGTRYVKMTDRIRFLRGLWRDLRVPWYARALLGAVVVYLLSPIDLIPDFIPLLGYLDDVLIAAAGFWVAMTLIPADIRKEHRDRVEVE